jgi:hypothetical protein
MWLCIFEVYSTLHEDRPHQDVGEIVYGCVCGYVDLSLFTVQYSPVPVESKLNHLPSNISPQTFFPCTLME